jgi:hypothetical protein
MSSDFDFLKDLGLKGDDFKDKSKLEIIDLISKKAAEKKQVIESEAEKELIENVNSKLPEVQKFFEKPFQIYVKEVGQKKKPSPVTVVGYIAETESVVVYFNDKLFQILENNLIKSADVLAELNAPKSKKSTPKKEKPKEKTKEK